MTKDEAVRLLGSKSNVARALGISRQAVSAWGDEVPALRVYQIKEIVAEGKEGNQ